MVKEIIRPPESEIKKILIYYFQELIFLLRVLKYIGGRSMLEILTHLNEIRQKKCIRILFVCTANCCRSPIAEILFEKMLINRLNSREISSTHRLLIESGATSYSGFSIAQNSAKVLIKEENISEKRCLNHTGRNLLEVDEPDLILTMTERHVRIISEHFSSLKNKTFSLDRFVKTDRGEISRDIEDPIGGNYGDYSAAKNHIKNDLTLLLAEFNAAGLLEPIKKNS